MLRGLLVIAYIAYGSLGSMMAQNSVEPMVKASWHQSAPFNNDCPDGAAAGCGAIAVAQILNYYKMPVHGFGHATYENVDVDFDTRSFDWSEILDSYSLGSYSCSEGNAVASLVYQVGAAMKMKYGSGSSPHNYPSMMWGLQHYLHFSPQSRYRYRHFYSTAEWIEMLDNELQNGRPVFYRGDHTVPGNMAGHMYVIDGRDSEGRYHVNFGHASKTQDKFVDLNIINQGEGTWPGVNSVSYHHRQAMVTDFYPVEGASDSDYDHTAIVLNSALVLEGQPYARTIEAKGTVQAKFQFRYVNFDGGTGQYSLGFYQGGELIAVAKTIRNTSLSAGGNAINVDRSFTLPDHLRDGNYELSVISRDDENSPWVRGWDNAQNRVPVSVKNDVYTFTMPNYHTLETYLYLEDGVISEVAGSRTDGKTLEFTVCNPSDNNFEDSLRLVVTSNGKSMAYEMLTSIYDSQKITYRFFVADSEIDTHGSYTVQGYYKEVNTGEWVLLQGNYSGVSQPKNDTFDGVEIYSLNGMLVERIGKYDIEKVYSSALSALPNGIYVVRDKNGTRRFVKH